MSHLRIVSQSEIISLVNPILLNNLSTCGCVVTIPTFEAEPGFAGGAHAVLGHRLHSLDHNVTVRARAEPQVWVAPMILHSMITGASFYYEILSCL